MARTPSTMVPLGSPLPAFALPTPDGEVVRSSSFAGRPLLVAFLSNHCPYVKHVQAELARLGAWARAQGVAVVGVHSNDVARYPDDAPELVRSESARVGYTFPQLVDATQAVAHAFRAACTPDFFLYDADGRLVYRGQLDDARPGSPEPVTGRDLRAAIDAVLAGAPPIAPQWPSMGCNIKWFPGTEP